jgi:hypothetical protein
VFKLDGVQQRTRVDVLLPAVDADLGQAQELPFLGLERVCPYQSVISGDKWPRYRCTTCSGTPALIS